jgi:septal ring factor EnvC (AmiA/AmiB activator)
MQPNRLQNALKRLNEALHETEAALEELRAERDPLAVHIFISRRQCRKVPETKSGKRSEVAARLSWQAASGLGFRGSLGEWQRLMGDASER